MIVKFESALMSTITQNRRTNINDSLRPVFHFTPPVNWMNDPNGLIHWKGMYHLFYQHNPYNATWGEIHWGHAISGDLVRWQDMPLALSPTLGTYDEQGVWSGCIVNDDGVATMLYTGVQGDTYQNQTICIATSPDDHLRTWHKYEYNPLTIDVPLDLISAGFRDPYVWRQDNMWKMVVGGGTKDGAENVLLFEGDSLYEWRYLDILISSDAQNDYVYECPNFFKLGEKWVLLVSVMPTSHVEYFVGLFWNNHFIVETHGNLGTPAMYAPLTFEDNNNRRIMMAWLQETRSESENEQAIWSGAMSTPIELMLLDNNQLALTPVREILDSELPTTYAQFYDVTVEDLERIQRELASENLKIVASDDLSKLIFIDGSVIEYFDFPNYRVNRVYDDTIGLKALAEFIPFPQKRLSIWTMPSTIATSHYRDDNPSEL